MKKAAKKPLQVLLIEDSEDDASLLELELERAGYEPRCERVETAQAMRAALQRQPWDVIISDYVLPRFNGLAALALVKQRGLDLPFIVVSGHITEDTAVAAMKAGAHDYVMKDRLARLGSAIEREMREAEVRRQRRQAEQAVRLANEELRRAHDELELRVQERTAELKRTNNQLQMAIRERKRLEHELLEIAENERRRIGLDLHDDLGQRLSGIALMIKGLELKLARKRVHEARDATNIHSLVQEAMNRTSNVTQNLAMLGTAETDLAEALRKLAAQAAELYDISCEFRSRVKLPALEPNVVHQLYKIAQEAVTNAFKHGNAKRISIALANGSDKLVLTVCNNGKPFPDLQTHSRTGMGLRIMEYRASTIDASFDIQPALHGAKLTCVVPLEGKK